MKREQRAALLLMHEAAAKALRDSLEADVAAEHEEHGVAASWRMQPATVSASISHDSVWLSDPPAFLRYLQERHPDEIVSVLQPRSTTWVSHMRKALIPYAERDPDTLKLTGRIVDADGTVVPGAMFAPGGRYISASVKPNKDHEAVLKLAAEHAVEHDDWTALYAYGEDGDAATVAAYLAVKAE